MSEIQKVRWSHDACIDLIIANPAITQRELSAYFGYTESWMSIICNSDAFKERLASRKAELLDPKLRATISERLDGLAKMALDKLMTRVELNMISNKDLIEAAKLSAGTRSSPSTQVNQSLYVVQMPPRASSSREWLETRDIVENEPHLLPSESTPAR